MSTSDAELLRRARELADEELYPRAIDVDLSGEVPTAQLDLLAEAGMYGVSVRAEPATVTSLIEIIASGCLTTAFVWTQHLGASAAAHHCEGAASRFAEDLLDGRLRGGVAFAHMLRGGDPLTVASPTPGGWTFRGRAPWVTGWGHIDLVYAAARHGSDIVWALVDATDGPTLQSSQPPIAAINSSHTVELEWCDHFIPDDRIVRVEDYDEWRARYRLGLRNNGSFPIGIASRCCRLLARPDFDARLTEARSVLDAASVDELPAARADAALFAVTAATALVADVGGRAVVTNHHAQRLHREAMFLLVQGQTPEIKAHMLARLASGASPGDCTDRVR